MSKGSEGWSVRSILVSRIFLVKRFVAIAAGLVAASGMAYAAAANTVGTMAGDFSVDKEGAAVYHIAITLPPGLHGLRPDLSLSYSSHGGQDTSGVGWALSGVSVITRCAQTLVLNGLNQSPDLTTNDRFCLDGQRLIALTNGSYETETYGAKLVTPGASVPAGPCGLGNGPATFSLVDKSGLTSTFGDTSDSTLVGNGYSTGAQSGVTWCSNPSRLEWPITRTSDIYGNFVSYQYYNDQNDPETDPADVYIKEIDYGSASGTVARVMFTYGATNAPTTGVFGFAATVYINSAPAILTGIQVTDGAGATLRTYTLGYASSTPTQLTSIRECGSDGSCFNPTTFSYQGSPSGFSSQPVKLSDNVMPMKKVLDLDGDGLPDYVFCPGDCSGDEGEIYVVFGSKITGTAVDTGMALDSGNFKINYQNAVIVSMYGDGKQQLLIPYYADTGGPADWKLFGWSGSKTNPQLIWLGDPPVNSGQRLPATGYGNALGIDLTGTGRTDLVFSYNNTLWYYQNTANGFDVANGPVNTGIPVNGQPRLIPVNYSGTGVAEMYVKGVGIVQAKLASGPILQNLKVEQNEVNTNFANGYTTDAAVFFDADGDGLTSVVLPAASGNAWCFFPNTGSGWDFNITTQNCTSLLDLSGAPDAQVVDWYGDGRQEVIYPLGGGWKILQTGLNGPSENWLYITSVNLNLPTRGDGNSGSFMDVDGDGEADMLYTSGGNTYFVHNDASPYLLNQVTNGLGMNTDISYVPLSLAQYTSAVANAAPPALNPPEVIAYTGSMMVVRDFAVDTGLVSGGGTPEQLYTYYKYTGAAVDQWGRGMLGFTEVESINYNSGLFTINHFSQQFPYQGMVTESDQYWNPSVVAPQVANVGSSPGGWRTRCTVDAASGEPVCTAPSLPTLEPVNFDTGTLIKKTVTTPTSISPYANVNLSYAASTVVSEYELGAPGPFATIETDSHYSMVGNGTVIGRDVEPDTLTVTTTDMANPNTDASVETTTTAYDPTTETKCPGKPSSVTIVDSFNEAAPATYPGKDKVESFTYDYNSTCAMLTDVKTIPAPPGSSAAGYPMDVESDYVMDGYGNAQKITVLGTSLTPRVTSMTFDLTHRFPVSTTNPLGQVSGASYDAWGNKLSETDLNGNTITHQFDGFERLVKLSGPGQSVYTKWAYGSCTGSDCVSGIAASEVSQTGSDLGSSKAQYDAQGRVIRTEKSGFGNSTIYQDTVYDLFGRVMAASKPYYSTASSTSCWEFDTYDVLGRLTQKDQATQQGVCAGPGADNDDSQQIFTYAGLTTTSKTVTTNNTGVGRESSTIVKNVLGKPDSITDALGNSNTYLYDPWGNTISITPPDGKTVSLVLDSEGHKLSLQDPDVGAWTYSNDALGDVLTQTDSNGQTQTNTYDQLGRLVQRQEPEGTSQWVYDIGYGGGVGKLAYKIAANGAWEGYAYDVYGHATDKITILNGQEYWVTNTFDSQGRVSQVVYPDMDGIAFSGTPVMPSQFTVAVDPANAAVFDLSWNLDAHNGAIYHAYRTAVATGQVVEVYAGPDTGAVDDGITVDGQYTWTLKACDGSTNCSAPASFSLNVILPPSVPGTPQVPVQSTQTTTSWPLSWQASSLGITGTPCPITYKLYQSTDGGSTYTQAGSAITQACGDNSAVITANASGGDGTYLYEVQACAGGACSAFSAPGSYTVLIQPSVPRQVQVPASTVPTGGSGSVAITWAAPAINGGNVVYNVSIQTGTSQYGVVHYGPLGSTGNLYYNDPEGTGSYIYQVVACNAANTNLCSAPVTTGTALMTIPPTSPGSPVPPNPDNHLQSWLVTWPASNLYSGSGTQGTITYYLYQSFGNTTSWTYAGSATSNFAYSPINTQNGTYYYEVKACVVDVNTQVNACSPMGGVSGYTTVIAPSVPTNVSAGGASNLDGSFTVTWTGPNNGVQVNSYTGKLGEWDTETQKYLWVDGNCNSSGAATSCTANPNTSGSLYVEITACETVGSVTACSTPSTPGGPVNVTIANPPTLSGGGNSPTGTGTLTWTSVTGVGHYALYASYQSASNNTWGAYSNIANPTGTSKAVSLTSAQSAAHYYVEACDSVSCTAASNTRTVTYTTPAAPGISGPSSTTDGNITVDWTSSSGATNYQLYSSRDKLGTWQPYSLIATSGFSYADKIGVTVQAVRYYVQACNAMGCGNPSSTLTVTYNLCGSSCSSDVLRPVRFWIEGAPVMVARVAVPSPTLEPLTAPTAPREIQAVRVADSGTSHQGSEDMAPVGAAPAMQVASVQYVPARTAVQIGGPRPRGDGKAMSGAGQSDGYGSRRAFMLAHQVTSRPVVRDVPAAQQLADVAWPPRAVDPRLSLYPPLRNDKRVKQQFASLGGVAPGESQAVADTEPTPVDAFMVMYQYTDPHGYLTDIEQLDSNGDPVRQLWVAGAMTPSGQVDQSVYDAPVAGGAGTLEIDDSYDLATGHMTGTQVTAGVAAQSLAAQYDWDGYSNLKDRVITQNGQQVLDESFIYDPMNRLSSVSTGAGGNSYSSSTGYDSVGDITSNGGYTAYSYVNTSVVVGTYQYSLPHAVAQATLPNGVTRSYQYDNDGNLRFVYENGTLTRQVDWYSFNKPLRITANGAIETFTYDGDYERLATSVSQGNGTDTTTYIDGIFESENNSATQTQTYRQYVLVGAARIAVDTVTAIQGGAPTEQLGYFVRDPVGSVIGQVTDSADRTQQQLSVYSYDSWGKERPTSSVMGQTAFVDLPPDQFLSDTSGQAEGFGGHENLSAVGLVEMEGRVYDPEVGRFLSADPNVQFPLSTSGYNRYTYVNDNPVSLSDPSGYDIFANLDPVMNEIGKQTGIDDLSEMVNDPTHTARMWAMSKMSPQEFNVVNTVGSAFCFYAAAACYGLGQYEYDRSQGAPADAALKAGAEAGAEYYIMHSFSTVTMPASYYNMFIDQLKNQAESEASQLFMDEMRRVAGRHGMSLLQLDAYLEAVSILGDMVDGSRNYLVNGHIDIVGFGHRGISGDVLFDPVDTLLEYQGIPSATGLEYIMYWRSVPIGTGHSLGALTANNLVHYGAAPSANLDALPFGAVGVGHTTVTFSPFDLVPGAIFGRLLNPGATQDNGSLLSHGACNVYHTCEGPFAPAMDGN